MRLEVGRLVGNPGVAGRMRFIEGVGCKGFPIFPNFLKDGRIVTTLCAPRDKLGLHFVQDVAQLFTHGLPEHVRLALGKACELLGEQHDLLLVHGNPVGLLEIFLHVGQIIRNLLYSMLPPNERRNVFQGSWTVERVHGNQIPKDRGFQVLEVFLHAGRFVLEDADCFATLEELIGPRVVHGDGLHVEFDSVTLFNEGDRILDQGQGLETQKVHF